MSTIMKDKSRRDTMLLRAPVKRTIHLLKWCGTLLSASLLAANVASSAAGQGEVFSSPEDGAAALIAAWQTGSTAQLLDIFGPRAKDLISSGDPVADRRARRMLAASYADAHRLEAIGPHEVVLVLGKAQWPYPIPLVGHGTTWRFDVNDGAEQIIDRRIGRNELKAIAICRAYVEAQYEFAARSRRLSGHPEYAQKVASTPSEHDGLYWPATQSDGESPFGPLVAAAEAQGYPAPNAETLSPFHGYFFRILTHQSANAPGGARDYVVSGHMTGGFALIAFPAKYGDSGVMTFIVNQTGIVYEKNLGPGTEELVRRITAYDPDRNWKISGF